LYDTKWYHTYRYHTKKSPTELRGEDLNGWLELWHAEQGPASPSALKHIAVDEFFVSLCGAVNRRDGIGGRTWARDLSEPKKSLAAVAARADQGRHRALQGRDQHKANGVKLSRLQVRAIQSGLVRPARVTPARGAREQRERGRVG
jgi:hypothetical protein